MIKEHCYSEEWLDQFKQQHVHQRIDKIILEKMIYALHLVERLQAHGLDFVFKGGTSLVLLLQQDNRFSIDIDIICKTQRAELENILQRVLKNSKFNDVELEVHRSYKEGVPKAHYSFTFESVLGTRYSGRIFLDILFDEVLYPQIVELPIKTKWIDVETETMVLAPSIDAITGDKLTAFAPGTTGIPYYKGSQSFAMEICKQLFDLSKLFDWVEQVDVVAASFSKFAQKELQYRNLSIPPESVLEDIIATCRILALKERNIGDDKSKFLELQKGIRAFGTGYLMAGHFRVDDAVSAAGRVAYLASKLMKQDLSPIDRFDAKDTEDLSIETPAWNFLNKLKKQPDKSSFFYWYKAVELLG